MGDSYGKVLEKRIITDSLTRLDMISEAATFLEFLSKKKFLKRGFLVLCESLDSNDDDDDDNGCDDWEEMVITLKNFIKKSEEVTQKEINTLQQSVARIEEKRKAREEELEGKINGLKSEFEIMNEKTDKMFALLVEMKQQFDAEQIKN